MPWLVPWSTSTGANRSLNPSSFIAPVPTSSRWPRRLAQDCSTAFGITCGPRKFRAIAVASRAASFGFDLHGSVDQREARRQLERAAQAGRRFPRVRFSSADKALLRAARSATPSGRRRRWQAR
jgi:hypothetical protein